MIVYWYEKHWEPGFIKWWKGYEALLNMNDFVAKLLELDKDKSMKILDAGCGVGGTCIYLANKYPKSTFIGITISKKQVYLARKFAKERNRNKNVHFMVMDYMKTRTSGYYAISARKIQ